MSGERSPDFRTIYSNAQSFAFTGTEIVITLLRAEPEMNEKGSSFKTGEARYIEEALVYIPTSQAKDMCEKILSILKNLETPATAPTS